MAATLKLISPDKAASWSEGEIKALAQSNPRSAMEMVIQKWRQNLFYHATYIVKDGQEAYDIVQEVFIRAMRERRFFNEDFKMKAWLFRVTSNLCFNTVRNRKRRGVLLETMVRPVPQRASQLEQVFADEQRSTVLTAMDDLSENHREILVLRYYDDLSYAEIAEVLGVKLGTVMSRLSRARQRLSDVMGEAPAA
jgi:RNA polymerase sigma-70 factor (ECF subfamily)